MTILRLKEIRETQMPLRNIKNTELWMKLYTKKTGQIKSKTTLWYWEKDESDLQYRTADLRYLKFLCEEFNYNPAYVLGLVNEPQFIIEFSDKEFPDTDRILNALNKNSSFLVAFCKTLLKRIPADVKKAHLNLYGKHPDIYADITNLANTLEKHPELFERNGT